MHVHASDRELTEGGSAKFFVKDNGDTILQNKGRLNDREVLKIQKFIKKNYREMFMKWSEYSKKGFYQK
jgi:thioredoxin-related protein